MSDIVERLRDKHCCDNGCHCDEAAAEIERLRAAVRECLGADDHLARVMPQRAGEGVIAAAIERVRAAKREARAVLAEEKKDDR